MWSSPSLRAAMVAKRPWLDVFCPGCQTSRAIEANLLGLYEMPPQAATAAARSDECAIRELGSDKSDQASAKLLAQSNPSASVHRVCTAQNNRWTKVGIIRLKSLKLLW
jgi:hypothetical protein